MWGWGEGGWVRADLVSHAGVWVGAWVVGRLLGCVEAAVIRRGARALMYRRRPSRPGVPLTQHPAASAAAVTVSPDGRNMRGEARPARRPTVRAHLTPSERPDNGAGGGGGCRATRVESVGWGDRPRYSAARNEARRRRLAGTAHGAAAGGGARPTAQQCTTQIATGVMTWPHRSRRKGVRAAWRVHTVACGTVLYTPSASAAGAPPDSRHSAARRCQRTRVMRLLDPPDSTGKCLGRCRLVSRLCARTGRWSRGVGVRTRWPMSGTITHSQRRTRGGPPKPAAERQAHRP